jgi:hypothetical protein
MNSTREHAELAAILPSPDGRFSLCPTVMTEEELIRFLRIPEISGAINHRHVIENLKRKHGLPRIHLCGKTVYLTDSVKQWLQQHVTGCMTVHAVRRRRFWPTARLRGRWA